MRGIGTMVEEARCLNPQCRRIAETRGLCNSCYATARELVSSKRTTWERLEAEAKVAPRKYKASGAKEWLMGIRGIKKKGT